MMRPILLAFALILYTTAESSYVENQIPVSPVQQRVNAEKTRHTEHVLPYVQPTYSLPFPEKYGVPLLRAGVSHAGMWKIAAAYEQYEDSYAFRKRAEPFPMEDAYWLAKYVSIVSGEGISPALIAAIIRIEPLRGVSVGGCSFFPENERLRVRSLAGEQKSFREIITKINETRHPRYQIKFSYPRVSCHYKRGAGGAMGIAQILPSVWLWYEPEIRRNMESDAFVSPYHTLPAFHGVAMILRDMAKRQRINPEDVTLENEEFIRRVAAAYNAGSNWPYHTDDGRYGGDAYKTARAIREQVSETSTL